MTATTPRTAPVRSGERIQVVDALRGFAILGILLFNMMSYSGQSFIVGSWEQPLDRAVVILLDFLVQAKFYSLFSFLFGWGMAVQMRRAAERDTRFLPVFLRRMVILFAFGALHSIFLWTGDILLMYAVLGAMLAVLFRMISPRALLLAALLFLSTRIVLALPGNTLDSARDWCINFTRCWTPDNALPESLYSTGTYWDVTRLRFQATANGFWWFPCYFGNVLAMMLLGLYAGKRELFANYDRHQKLFRNVLWVGLGVGILLNGVFAYVSAKPFQSEYYTLIAIGARTFGAPAMTLFYITGITTLFQREKWRERLEPLASVGRMALTNYISHSLLLSFVFYGYGLGLYGRIGPTFGVLLTLLVYRFQIQLSRWWLERYRFGPLEWLWRRLTYMMRLPFSQKQDYDTAISQPDRNRSWLLYLLAVILILGIPLGYLRVRKGLIKPGESIPENQSGEEAEAEEDTGDDHELEADPAEGFSESFFSAIQDATSPALTTTDLTELASAFSGEKALQQVEILASGRFQGRYAGSPGGAKAAAYISGQFQESGLIPVGGGGNYFQSFPMDSLILDQVPVLRIASPDGTIREDYQLHEDLVPVLGQYAGAARGEGQVIWAGDCSEEDFHQLDVVGKIVLCRSSDLQEQSRQAAVNGAAGLLLYTRKEIQPPAHRSALEEAWIPDPIPVFQIYQDPAADLLAGSGYSVSDLSTLYQPVDLPASVTMEISASPSCAAPPCSGQNVLGLLPGWDSAFSDRVIIISSSYDSLGEAPDGQIWPGANFNASGTATLLEIARSWHEQGFHPRMTILFAAWDAGRQDSLGSEYFQNNPNFPLENTAAVIHLNGLGAGGAQLEIRSRGLATQAVLAVRAAGAEAVLADEPPSLADFFPGPVIELGWGGTERIFRLPSDRVEAIDPLRLAEAGKSASSLALQLSETPPAIQDLLDSRCSAIIENDLPAFLDSSTAERIKAETDWFSQVQALTPFECEAVHEDLLSSATTARADVEFTIEYQGENSEDPVKLRISSAARFLLESAGWRWGGPEVVSGGIASLGSTRVAVFHPANQEETYSRLGNWIVEEYQRITTALSLPPSLEAEVIVYPDRDTLSADTQPTDPARKTQSVETNTLRFTSNPLRYPEELRTTVAQLLLKNAGIPREQFPWLWDGLPQLLARDRGEVVLESDQLSHFHSQLARGEIGNTALSSWAAVSYLQQNRGWAGTGRLITALGEACQVSGCDTEAEADLALASSLGMNREEFQAAWQEHWLGTLDLIQEKLDAVLSQRVEAVLAQDQDAFLGTVSPRVPGLVGEEKGWFADLEANRTEQFQLSGTPIAIQEDGSVLVKVILQYRLEDQSQPWSRASLPVEILFMPRDGDLLWAGPMLESLVGNRVQVLYPPGTEQEAQAALEAAQSLASKLAGELDLAFSPSLTIKLYDNPNQYRTSISLSYPAPDWMPGWTAPDQSVKLLLDSRGDPVIDEGTLIWHLTRNYLSQLGVSEEWLLSGGSIYLAGDAAGGVLGQKASASLLTLNSYLLHEQAYSLDEMPDLYRLPEDDYWVAAAHAWDAAKYLADRYGKDTLLSLLKEPGDPTDPDQALIAATGMSLAQFGDAWESSFSLGHLPEEALEVSLELDPDRALAHIHVLTQPEMAGRQAGSEGAGLAADYIMEKFSEVGLAVEEQSLSILYRKFLEEPSLVLTFPAAAEDLIYREDFLVLQAADLPQGLDGELVWIADRDYEGMDLDGKIAVRKPTQAILAEIAAAREHGAAGLILVGEKNRPEDLQARYPFPAAETGEEFPVLELTRAGFDRLLELTGQTMAALSFTDPAIPLGGSGALQMSLSSPAAQETSNIIGYLPGADPDSRDEVVILGAHYDHVGDEFGVRYSGANDNASGVAVLLEIARVWHEAGYQPDKSVVFIAWGAQESGELGSNHYLANPVIPLENTSANIQLDAVGGGEGYFLEASGHRDHDGVLLLGVKKAAEAADTRLMLISNRETRAPSSAWLFSAGFIFDPYNIVVTSDDLPFREEGIPTLLLRWKDADERNLPDSLADEVLPERLETTGITTSLTLMILAR